MENIFLVQIIWDRWESHPITVTFTETPEEAEKIVNKVKDYYDYIGDIHDKIVEKRKSIDVKELEDKFGGIKERVQLTKWREGLGEHEITDEMRKLRDEEIANRDSVSAHNQSVYDKVNKHLAEKILEFTQSLELSDEVFKAVGEFTFKPYSVDYKKVEKHNFFNIKELA